MSRFLEFAKANRCIPDFIGIQCYPHLSIADDEEFFLYALTQESSPSILSADEHYTRTILKECKELLKKYGLQELSVWIEEWNSTLWQRDISGDTCYKAAWLVKNLSECYDEAESFGYWLLSDFIEERAAFGDVFHGGYGLFTYNCIPKSGWLAMQMMRNLGDRYLDAGDGWLITKTDRGLQIILNHYCHYDALYRLRYKKLSDPRKAYSVFMEKGNAEYSISLTGLKPGRYEIKRYSITAQQGSSFDTWLSMGKPKYLRESESVYLKRAAQPGYYLETRDLDSDYLIETTLQPHEIRMFLLERIE